MSDKDSEPTQALEFSWRVHTAQEAWTEKADFKAALLLPAQLGILTILGAVFLSDRRPKLSICSKSIIALGIIFIGIAIVFVALVVIPRLTTTMPEKNDLIYFGHLKQMDAKQIQLRIQKMSQEDQLEAVSVQLFAMSKINWRKHSLLRLGIILTAAGTALCAVPLLVIGLKV